jgi:hypothetical protein
LSAASSDFSRFGNTPPIPFGLSLYFPIILSLSKEALARPTAPVRAEPVEACAYDGAGISTGSMRTGEGIRIHGHFDKPSPNGVGFVFGWFAFPIILSLSKDKLSANGLFLHLRCLKFP